jgi:hypothetical protein
MVKMRYDDKDEDDDEEDFDKCEIVTPFFSGSRVRMPWFQGNPVRVRDLRKFLPLRFAVFSECPEVVEAILFS